MTSATHTGSTRQLLAEPAAKRFATLQAAAAFAGFQVSLIESDSGRAAFIVSRWALTRQVDALDELAEFLRRAGVAA